MKHNGTRRIDWGVDPELSRFLAEPSMYRYRLVAACVGVHYSSASRGGSLLSSRHLFRKLERTLG